jgi:hypothetical protein
MSTINPQFTPEFVDQRLFGSGRRVSDYVLCRTPRSEVIMYTDNSGKAFYLSINNDELWGLLKKRLVELGVKIQEDGFEKLSSHE